MSEDRKLNTRLDLQIGLWLLSQERIQQREQEEQQGRVIMEYVAR